MRLATLILSLAAACALVPAAAAAQSIISDPAAALSTRDISPAAQARDSMNRYAECIVKTHTTAVRRALSETAPAAVTIALANLADRDCLRDGELQMGTSLFRGALYRALYLRDFGTDAALPPSDLALEPSSNPLLEFGNCVAAFDPAQTQAFVVSKPATTAETEAITKLGASFGRCVAPGNQAQFSRTVLQGALAEALYKRSAAIAARAEQAEVK